MRVNRYMVLIIMDKTMTLPTLQATQGERASHLDTAKLAKAPLPAELTAKSVEPKDLQLQQRVYLNPAATSEVVVVKPGVISTRMLR